MIEDFFKLNDDYMKAHPNAENPSSYVYVFGIDALTQLIKLANGKELKFKVVDDVTDSIDVYIDNKKINLDGTL
ncbi:MAG: hypothetical protein RL516_1071 [Bacteroidota bacterium]|jgi:hypothetical protein